VEAATRLDDLQLVRSLRDGDEAAFALLAREYHHSLLRVARIYVSSRAVAEEVVQETWLGVLQGLDRFEGRSSLRTWVFRILTNIAKTRAQREGRTLPFSALARPDAVPEPAVEPERFRAPDDPAWPGHWSAPPQAWNAPRGAASRRRGPRRRRAGDRAPRTHPARGHQPPGRRGLVGGRSV
jgi:RNA polymerase sigma-70 factor, ECF subfamily